MSTKKRLLTNFLALASVQGLNFILPLITLPYLTTVLGPSKYGLISFAQAFIQYFILFTDYGFVLVATRDISLARDDKRRVSIIFSTVMLIRIMLLIISFIVLLMMIYFIPKFQVDSMIYLLTFGMVIGNVLFPVWFFQGMEQMKIISLLNIGAKAIFTVGIFIYVQSESDFFYVPLLNSLGYITIGLISLYFILFKHKIKIMMPSKSDILYQLKEGWYIFVSNMVTSLYTTSNIFVLGFFASNTVVGYYASAERVVKAISSLIGPLVQTLYPFLSRALQESRERTMWMLSRIFALVTVSMGIVSLFIALNVETIVDFLGSEYKPAIPLMKILAALPLILGWANVLGILTMINFDYKKQLSQIYIAASILSIIIMTLFIPSFKEYGAAYNAIVTEAFATALMLLFLWKKGINVWKWRR